MGRLLTQTLIVVATDPLQDGLESMLSSGSTLFASVFLKPLNGRRRCGTQRAHRLGERSQS